MIHASNELQEYIETALQKQYTFIETLKKADSGEILLYEHNESKNRLVVIRSKHINDEVYRALQGQKFENLAQIYETCVTEEGLLILEEYIEGVSLASLLKEGPLPYHRAAKYAVALCDALEVLHRRNIVHRDVKPSNIWITPEDKAVLLDFNIARIITDFEEHDTRPLGTVGYAAPEQFGFAQSGKTTDIYALGVCLNVMLTGKHPSVATPKGGLHKVVSKATTVQISGRYQTVGAMRKALNRFVKKD